MQRSYVHVVVVTVWIAWLPACASSDVSRSIGARCASSTECDDRCLTESGSYPDGFCTVTCDRDSDCAAQDTTCVDDESGVCLFTCRVDEDCTFLGVAWACRERDERGGTEGATVMVCRGS